MIRGIEEAFTLGGTELQCFTDSNLVVQQLNGNFKIKESHLKILNSKIKGMIFMKPVSFHFIRREKNILADKLVNNELDKQL
jgi:ribonuclease HI